jgi:ABC-type molybdate transport system substrate-binding protein/cytochrome c5
MMHSLLLAVLALTAAPSSRDAYLLGEWHYDTSKAAFECAQPRTMDQVQFRLRLSRGADGALVLSRLGTAARLLGEQGQPSGTPMSTAITAGVPQCELPLRSSSQDTFELASPGAMCGDEAVGLRAESFQLTLSEDGKLRLSEKARLFLFTDVCEYALSDVEVEPLFEPGKPDVRAELASRNKPRPTVIVAADSRFKAILAPLEAQLEKLSAQLGQPADLVFRFKSGHQHRKELLARPSAHRFVGADADVFQLVENQAVIARDPLVAAFPKATAQKVKRLEDLLQLRRLAGGRKGTPHFGYAQAALASREEGGVHPRLARKTAWTQKDGAALIQLLERRQADAVFVFQSEVAKNPSLASLPLTDESGRPAVARFFAGAVPGSEPLEGFSLSQLLRLELVSAALRKHGLQSPAEEDWRASPQALHPENALEAERHEEALTSLRHELSMAELTGLASVPPALTYEDWNQVCHPSMADVTSGAEGSGRARSVKAGTKVRVGRDLGGRWVRVTYMDDFFNKEASGYMAKRWLSQDCARVPPPSEEEDGDVKVTVRPGAVKPLSITLVAPLRFKSLLSQGKKKFEKLASAKGRTVELSLRFVPDEALGEELSRYPGPHYVLATEGELYGRAESGLRFAEDKVVLAFPKRFSKRVKTLADVPMFKRIAAPPEETPAGTIAKKAISEALHWAGRDEARRVLRPFSWTETSPLAALKQGKADAALVLLSEVARDRSLATLAMERTVTWMLATPETGWVAREKPPLPEQLYTFAPPKAWEAAGLRLERLMTTDAPRPVTASQRLHAEEKERAQERARLERELAAYAGSETDPSYAVAGQVNEVCHTGDIPMTDEPGGKGNVVRLNMGEQVMVKADTGSLWMEVEVQGEGRHGGSGGFVPRRWISTECAKHFPRYRELREQQAQEQEAARKRQAEEGSPAAPDSTASGDGT